MAGKYFPNNWQEYYDAPDNMFIPHTFEELMSWKIGQWEIPSSVCCIIRTTDRKSRKVKEFVYQRRADAQRKLNTLMEDPDCDIAICDHEAIHFLTPEEPTNV